MPDPIIGAIISGAVGLFGASKQSSAASDAADVQSGAAREAAALQLQGTQESIAENRRQFDFMQELLSPYTGAGQTAIHEQMDMLGWGGREAEQETIDRIKGGAEYQETVRAGEDAILANASATGGLRGGNVQRSLAEFRPSILNSLLDKQFSRAGELAGRGVGAATGVGNAGVQSAASSGALRNAGYSGAAGSINLGGSAQAAGFINQGNAWAGGAANLGNAVTSAAGIYGGKF